MRILFDVLKLFFMFQIVHTFCCPKFTLRSLVELFGGFFLKLGSNSWNEAFETDFENEDSDDLAVPNAN